MALVREYKLLRDVIWQGLADRASQEAWSIPDVFAAGNVLHRALDEVIAIAVEG